VTEEPGTRTDPRVARTRAVVLEAATGLLAERGYSGFSVEGVVDRTGVAKTTIYRHWPSRDELLAAVIGQLAGTGQLPDTGSVRQDLLDYFAGRVRAAHTRQWERCMPALVEAAARHPELATMVARLTARALSQIEALLRRGIERGEIRPSVSPQLAASALMGPLVFRRLLLQEVPTSQHVATVVDLVMQGICQPEPTDQSGT
jgi:AcrR family transcriptional regulator